MSQRFGLHRLSTASLFSLPLMTLLVPLLGGCVALNIPSVRYDDPDDRGGPLGPHRAPVVVEDSLAVDARTGAPFEASVAHDSWSDQGCADFEQEPPPKPPEVPWPRFHPLPTRPVFTSLPVGPSHQQF